MLIASESCNYSCAPIGNATVARRGESAKAPVGFYAVYVCPTSGAFHLPREIRADINFETEKLKWRRERERERVARDIEAGSNLKRNTRIVGSRSKASSWCAAAKKREQ